MNNAIYLKCLTTHHLTVYHIIVCNQPQSVYQNPLLISEPAFMNELLIFSFVCLCVANQSATDIIFFLMPYLAVFDIQSGKEVRKF
jgi:hypothetical protein